MKRTMMIVALMSAFGAHAQGGYNDNSTNTDSFAAASAIAGAGAVGQGGNATGGESNASGGSASIAGDRNRAIAIALPQPVTGASPVIRECTVAGHESVGLLFNFISHSRTTLQVDRFCAMITMEAIARASGTDADLETAERIRMRMYKEFAGE